MILDFIPIWVWGIVLAVGILGLFFKNRLSMMLGKLGSPLGLKTSTTLMVLSVIALLMGGFGAITSFAGGFDIGTASVADTPQAVGGSVTGDVAGQVANGLTNTSGLTQGTTEDYYSDDKKQLTFYSADAGIDDTLGYAWNITIERQKISEDANIKVSCSAPDKELAGVTQKNLFQKTGGQIDLTFVGGSSTGTHSDDTTVYTYVPMAEGTGSAIIEVTALHLDAYHDGMADLDDYFDTVCTITGDGSSDSILTRVFANS